MLLLRYLPGMLPNLFSSRFLYMAGKSFLTAMESSTSLLVFDDSLMLITKHQSVLASNALGWCRFSLLVA